MAMNPATDKVFAGSIPAIYESHLVPLIFEPYAADLATRLAAIAPARVLEVAAGTGVVTRRLAASLAAGSEIVATDLNQAMLDKAAAVGTQRPVRWQQADALQLPFDDASFDAVACQFGVMFFPDKAKAFSEARRVLRPGGVFMFNAWDRIEENEFADEVTRALATVFPSDPPRFMARVPHGYHDVDVIARDLRSGGFDRPAAFEALERRSNASSAEIPAIAYCQGTPLRSEIEARDAAKLAQATAAAAQALAKRFGGGPISGKIRAHVAVVTR